jgi:hypothetical protein
MPGPSAEALQIIHRTHQDCPARQFGSSCGWCNTEALKIDQLAQERALRALVPYVTSTVDVDGVIDEKNGIIYLGKATRQPDGTWRAMANVGGSLCVVECRITPETKT